MSEDPAATRDFPLILVLAGSPDGLDSLTRPLESANLTVSGTTRVEDALAALERQQPDAAVIALDHTVFTDLNSVRQLNGLYATAGLPLIVAAPEELLRTDDLIAFNVADFVLQPARPRELARRVLTALARSRVRRARRQGAEELRRKSRQITAAIRATHDPQKMADLVVQDLGRTFAANCVSLLTFDDERVPSLATTWKRGVSSNGSVPTPAVEAGRSLSEELWEAGRVLAVEQDGNIDGEGGRHAQEHHVAAEFGRIAGIRGGGPAAAAPLGQGSRAFGLLWIDTDDPDRVWTSTELALIQHISGNLSHGLVQGQLITGQQEVMARMRQLDNAKTEFVAAVNHELRTPLTSIMGYLDIISDDEGELPDDAVRILEIVRRNAERLYELIENLLTLAQRDSQVPLQPVQPIAMSALLHGVVEDVAPLAAGRTLVLNETAPDLVVNGDAIQLKQVFINVLGNAVKFTPRGGSVTIDMSQDEAVSGLPRVRIRIADTGIGIPAEDIPNLFQRFFRGRNAAEAAIPGTGLGLAIVQEIVHQHGGELSITSVLGQGTEVNLEFPAQPVGVA